MIRDEDGADFGISGRTPQMESRVPGLLFLRQKEADEAEAEPYALEQEILRDNDMGARAYMAQWGHYESAYNAVQHRAQINGYIEQILDLIEAFTGVRPDTLTEEPWDRLLHRVGLERTRLSLRAERAEETAESVRAELESGYTAIHALADLADWFGASTEGTPATVALAIKASVVNQKGRT